MPESGDGRADQGPAEDLVAGGEAQRQRQEHQQQRVEHALVKCHDDERPTLSLVQAVNRQPNLEVGEQPSGCALLSPLTLGRQEWMWRTGQFHRQLTKQWPAGELVAPGGSQALGPDVE